MIRKRGFNSNLNSTLFNDRKFSFVPVHLSIQKFPQFECVCGNGGGRAGVGMRA